MQCRFPAVKMLQNVTPHNKYVVASWKGTLGGCSTGERHVGFGGNAELTGALLFGGATVDSGLAEGLSGGFGAEVQCPRLRVWRECRLSVCGLLSLWWPSLNRVGQS